MTKGEALYNFFSGFGIPAYVTTAVPDDAVFPWLTYTAPVDAYLGGTVSLTVNIWDYATNEADINRIVDQLSKAIGIGGVTLPCDDGFIWLTRGTPWCQPISDETSEFIKRRYINITAEYLTTY